NGTLLRFVQSPLGARLTTLRVSGLVGDVNSAQAIGYLLSGGRVESFTLGECRNWSSAAVIGAMLRAPTWGALHSRESLGNGRGGNVFGNRFQRILGSPHLQGLRSFAVSNGGLRSEDFQALGHCSSLQNLTSLTINDAGLGDEGLRLLSDESVLAPVVLTLG